MNMFSRFMNDKSGATAIEYGLIAAIVAVGIIASLKSVSGSLQNTFTDVSTRAQRRLDALNSEP